MCIQLGYHVYPRELKALQTAVKGAASHSYSCASAPIQYAAVAVRSCGFNSTVFGLVIAVPLCPPVLQQLKRDTRLCVALKTNYGSLSQLLLSVVVVDCFFDVLLVVCPPLC